MRSMMHDARLLVGTAAMLSALTACGTGNSECNCTGNVGESETAVDMLCGASRCIDAVRYTCVSHDRVTAGEACTPALPDAGIESIDASPAAADGSVPSDGSLVDGSLVDGGPGVTVAYVISTMDMPAPVGDVAVGFDLDAMVSLGGTKACEDILDYESSLNGPGVDNQLGVISPLIDDALDGGLAGRFEAQIAAGTHLLIIELEGVNDFDSDGSVMVHLFQAAAVGPISLVGERIAPGQSFTVVAEIGTVPGRISDGVLVSDTLDLPLSLDIDGSIVDLRIDDAVVTGMVTPDQLTNGEIGGALPVDRVVAALRAMGFAEVDRAIVEALTPPDLRTSAAVTCDVISVGISYAAVQAQTAATASPRP